MNDQLFQLLDQLYSRPNDEVMVAQARQKNWAVVLQAQREQTFVYDGFAWDIAHNIWFVVGAKGLVSLQMGDITETEFVTAQRGRLGVTLQRDPQQTEAIKAQLLDYLMGERDTFDVPVDWSQMRPFQAEVLQHAMQIPRGQVSTYGELAAALGKPKSARAVGRALGTNPIPIVIPCHRVVGANGDLTGYIGGVKVKAYLLQLEGYVA